MRCSAKEESCLDWLPCYIIADERVCLLLRPPAQAVVVFLDRTSPSCFKYTYVKTNSRITVYTYTAFSYSRFYIQPDDGYICIDETRSWKRKQISTSMSGLVSNNSLLAHNDSRPNMQQIVRLGGSQRHHVTDVDTTPKYTTRRTY